MVGSQERPQERQKAIFPERVVTERVVTIALMGVGLKLEQPLGGNAWGPAWRLLGVTMVLRMLLPSLCMGHGSLGRGTLRDRWRAYRWRAYRWRAYRWRVSAAGRGACVVVGGRRNSGVRATDLRPSAAVVKSLSTIKFLFS